MEALAQDLNSPPPLLPAYPEICKRSEKPGELLDFHAEISNLTSVKHSGRPDPRVGRSPDFSSTWQDFGWTAPDAQGSLAPETPRLICLPARWPVLSELSHLGPAAPARFGLGRPVAFSSSKGPIFPVVTTIWELCRNPLRLKGTPRCRGGSLVPSRVTAMFASTYGFARSRLHRSVTDRPGPLPRSPVPPFLESLQQTVRGRFIHSRTAAEC